jgi:hypothetical protein
MRRHLFYPLALGALLCVTLQAQSAAPRAQVGTAKPGVDPAMLKACSSVWSVRRGADG